MPVTNERISQMVAYSALPAATTPHPLMDPRPNKRKRGGPVLQILPSAGSDCKKNALDVYRSEQKGKNVSNTEADVSNSLEEEDVPDKVTKCDHGAGNTGNGWFDVVAHNVRVHREFEALSEAEKACLQVAANQRNAGSTLSNDTGFTPSMREFQRSLLVSQLPDVIHNSWDYYHKETGWCGVTIAGGVDHFGSLTQFSNSMSKDYKERSLVHYICKQAGWSLDRWDAEILNWLRNVFDAPEAPSPELEPMEFTLAKLLKVHADLRAEEALNGQAVQEHDQPHSTGEQTQRDCDVQAMELNGPEERIDLHDALNELQTDQAGNMQNCLRAEDKLTDPTDNATEAEEPEKRRVSRMHRMQM
ncbi:hypothetical protein EW026_g8241 [Hermanssonia centrifuga]|uniref:Uncharacterized protein n=1 Tax=Hermanssonia centrifuga TaxID=98765 RepID=A0A4S4K4Y0_9APHY|nr:hypothetical protein EW026_g8241 [Hermanssonia centrifuga]